MNGLWLLAGAASALVQPALSRATADPFLGTWQLDKTRSVIAHDPGVKSKQFVFAPTADGVAITETLEMATGEKSVSHLTYAYGRATPQTGPGFDSFTVERTDDRTAIWTVQKAGVTLSRLEVVLSPDGRQMTFRYLFAASDPTGRTANDRYVYVRQPA